MASSRYVYASDVLPKKLVEKCKEALLYKSKVISFGNKATYTKSEKELGVVLSRQCRKLLSTDSKAVNVLFRGERFSKRKPNPRRELVILLVNKGFTAQSVADAVGASRESVAKWASSKRDHGSKGHEDYSVAIAATSAQHRTEEAKELLVLGATALLMRTMHEDGWASVEAQVRLISDDSAFLKEPAFLLQKVDPKFADMTRHDIARRALFAGKVVREAMAHEVLWKQTQTQYGKWVVKK